MNKTRIESVDLLKGFCILFVILYHCQYDVLPPQLNHLCRNIALSGFFFAAGFFFPAEQSFWKFALHKFNRLIIPYLFFNLLWLGVVAITGWDPHFELTLAYLADFFLDPANLPTWFLPPLFFLHLLYFGINRMPHRIRLIAIIIITVAGWVIAYNYSDSHSYFWHEQMRLHLPIAMISLPLIHAGHLASKNGLLTWNPRVPIAIAVFIVAFAISYLCSAKDVNLYAIVFDNSPIPFYIAAYTGIAWVWMLSCKLHKAPFITFFGRNSLTALCVHFPIIFIAERAGITATLPLFATSVAATTLLIVFFTRYCPFATAQRDLLVYDKSRKTPFSLNLHTKTVKKN